MSRTTAGYTTRRRHKKVLKLTKGFRGGRSKVYKRAKEALMKAGMHAFVDRRTKKRTFRALWNSRISAAARAEGLNYSTFIGKLFEKHVLLNRKVLSELAFQHPEVFKNLVEQVK